MNLLKTALWYNGYGYLKILTHWYDAYCQFPQCQFWWKQKHWKMLTCCIILSSNLHWQLLDKGFYIPTQISYLTLIITQSIFDLTLTWLDMCMRILVHNFCAYDEQNMTFMTWKKNILQWKKMCTSQKLHCAQLKWDQTDEGPKKTI